MPNGYDYEVAHAVLARVGIGCDHVDYGLLVVDVGGAVQAYRTALKTRVLDTIERALLASSGNDCRRRYLAVSRAIADERARIAGVEDAPESAPVSVLRVLDQLEAKAAAQLEASRKPSQWGGTVVTSEAGAVFEFVRDFVAAVRAECGAL